jgi:photosystem II stability/assembly factor-like uncharacterized protein
MEKDNKHKLLKKYLIYIIYSIIIFVLSSFDFQGSPKSSGWYQQWFPNMNGSTIASLTFLDSLTGYAVTSINSDTLCYILKTTNGGDNWNIKYSYHPPYTNISFNKIQFVNNTTGYASAEYTSLFKTTNGGDNWNTIYTGLYPQDMAVINKDTILFVYNSLLTGGVWRSTNGGLSWQALGPIGGSGQPSRIYMYNKDLGFNVGNTGMKKTTNGGVNWFTVTGQGCSSIILVDSMVGWKCWDSIKKTTNGGLNWFAQKTPNVSHSFMNGTCFSALNKDTVWMVGALSNYSNPINPIYKTTNGGINWGYQNADSAHLVGSFGFILFINKNIGWAKNNVAEYLIHTTTGGNDTTFYTGINSITQIPPKNFELKQNYPNPYNNSTLIEYYINESGWVKLKIFDIAGREMATLVNEVQSTGGYGVPVSVQLSSGVYFYKLIYTNKKGEMQMDVKKMVVLK